MALSVVYKPIGPSVALSVTASAHAAVAVTAAPNETGGFAEFMNPSSTQTVFVSWGQLSATGAAQAPSPTPVFPVDGTPSVATGLVLPPLMTQPIVAPVPFSNGGFSVTAIGSAAGPTIIYVTPMSAQS